MPKCLNPLPLKSGIVVQCGKCPNCRLSNAQSWMFRLACEVSQHSSAYFVTLTYADVRRSASNFSTLLKTDLQTYFKNLRNEHYSRYKEFRTIKYYAVGEYGGRTSRPHYHAIVFGSDFDLLESAWRDRDLVLGSIHVGSVSVASIQYVTKYLCKPPWQRKHARDDRQRHFSLMSKGLGLCYLTPEVVDYHRSDLSRNFVLDSSGRKVSMPRYFKRLMYTRDELSVVADHMRDLSAASYARKLARYIKRFGNDIGFIYAEEWRRKFVLRTKFNVLQSNRQSL